MHGTIFISYRRGQDAAAAGRLYDRLEHTFSAQRLFMDVDNIPPGEDFVAVLEAQVAACDVLLALIGRGWLTGTDNTGRRLENPNDFVRIEIASALAQGKRVIPVLIDDAMMPRANELPEELMPLARRQAVRITHDRFRDDVERLARALEKALAQAKRQVQEEERPLAEEETKRKAEAKRRAETPDEDSAWAARDRKAAERMSGSVFEQHFLAPVENVYNVNGDLLLSRTSNAADVTRELKTLRTQVKELQELDAQTKETSVRAVDAAIEETQKSKSKAIEIQKHLDTAASAIEKTQGIADNGLKLAKTLFNIGKWVVALL